MCLGGSEGSVLDLFGGEYEFDNFNVKLHAARGQDTGVTILYGKNLTDITSDVNISSAYTAVYPYAIDEERDGLYTLTEKVIETDNTNFGEPRVLSLDLTEKFNLPDEEITETKLRNLANSYITNNHISDVKQNIEISFVQLWQTPEYKDIALLQRVGLCDTVTVRYAKLGVSVKTKVIKTVYNSLTEKYEKIELGKAKSNFGMTLKESVEQIEKEVARNKSAMQKAIENATRLITGQDGGYVVMNTTADGHPYEILIMNTDDIQTATKLWRWNLGGLGYSSTGYSGQYGTAITMDGAIVANYITTGTLNAGLIKTGIIEDEQHTNYWNMNTGEFKLSNGTTDAVKFENGTLTINAGFITTGSLNAARITAGVLQDSNGTNYWNLDTGEFRLSASTKVGTSASNQTLSNYVNSAASSAASGSLTQQNVFNALTNNGALQGIFMSGGNLYINGTYISSGAINASLITTGSLNANLITTGTISSTSSHTKFDLSNGRITLNLSNDSWLTDSGRLELDAFGITLFDSATGTNDIGALTNIKVVDAQSGTTTIKSKIITDYGEISNLEATKISSVSELNGHPLQR
ncbi:MAG: phage tail protein, partial [Bacteroidales bacterium]|nr:phage tail protein [Bacteroidales bacterium]